MHAFSCFWQHVHCVCVLRSVELHYHASICVYNVRLWYLSSEVSGSETYKMDDIGYFDCRRLFVGICFLCIFSGFILLYTVLLTICTCFLCRRLRRYARNSGREHPILCRSVNASCTVEMMCCCCGCKIAPPMEDNTISEGKSRSVLLSSADTL